jgi:protoporphyrinogen/coproporphyrinogen III oxidase
MKSVAVIGGGITGLTAAFYLHRVGVPVTLYEKTWRTGGAIRSTVEGGFLTEDGPSQITETAEVSALVNDLGIAGRRLYPNGEAKTRFVVKNGVPVEVPSSPGSFLSTKLFSASAKMRLLAEPFIARGRGDREESIGEFVKRRLGPEILDYAVDPLISGIFAGDPARISLRSAFPKLYQMEQASGSLTGAALNRMFHKKNGSGSRKLFSFDRGCQVLPDAIAESLGTSVRLNSAVQGITKCAEGWQVTTGTTEVHAAVVLTAPAYELGAMNASPSIARLREIVYPPIARVTLGFREEQFPHPVRGFGFLVPGRENFQVLGTVFASSVYSGRAPIGCVNLSSYLGGLRHPDIASKNANELMEATLSDYRTLLGVRGEPIYRSQKFIPYAIPQYTLGYQSFQQWMTDLERADPGLFFAGNYRDGISVADSVGSGVKAARRLTQFVHG